MRQTTAGIIILLLLTSCSSHTDFNRCLLEEPPPQSITDAVDRIALLPGPVTVPCFVASLPRPLDIVATDNIFSAQPANGRENPRVFILSEGLVLSIVMDGPGQHLVEFGEWVSSTHTIKGELSFPTEPEVDPNAPYDVLADESSTRCGFCHLGEVESPDRPGAYVSAALQPQADTLVPINELNAEYISCNSQRTPERCDMFHALFDQGPVREGAFDEEVQYIF